MTDTPPFYWMNGEDGPLEEEDDPPADGVLAARPMPGVPVTAHRSGPMDGLDLSRNKDMQRHGHSNFGATSAGCVDRSGMPGGGLQLPRPLQVQGFPGAGPPSPMYGGNSVQRCSSIGPPAPGGMPRTPGIQRCSSIGPGTPGGVTRTPGGSGPPPMVGMPGAAPHGPGGFGVPGAPPMHQQPPGMRQTLGGAPPWAMGPPQHPGQPHQGQPPAQAGPRGLACTPMQVQRCASGPDCRPRSPAPNVRPKGPGEFQSTESFRRSGTPGACNRRLETPTKPRGEIQADSFQRSGSFVANGPGPNGPGLQHSGSVHRAVSSTGAQRSGSFVAGPPEDASPLHSNSFFAPSLSPMGTPLEASARRHASSPQPHGTPSARSLFAASPSHRSARPTPVPSPTYQGYPGQLGHPGAPGYPGQPSPAAAHRPAMNPYAPRQTLPFGHPHAQNPHAQNAFLTPPFAGPSAGMWSAPVHGQPVPRPISAASVAPPPGNLGHTPNNSGRRSMTPISLSPENRCPNAQNSQFQSQLRPRLIEVDVSPAGGAPKVLPPSERSRRRAPSTDMRAQPALSPTPSNYSFGLSRPTPTATPDGQQFARHQAAPPEGQPQELSSGFPPSTLPENETGGTFIPRVLVTGATGLLGRQVMEALDGLSVRGICFSRGREPLVACDLTSEGEVAKQIVEFRPHVVIHLAGERRPDTLRRSPAHARLLNVDASGAIAAACEYCSAWLIFVSADAVFDGTAAPYAETDSPNPLSEYGWHKLHAEKLVLAACPRAAVLRVPLLYGPVEFPTESQVTTIYQELRGGKKQMNSWQMLYPTWTGDVAKILRTMVNAHVDGRELRGVFHWQAKEQFTKYDIARIIAGACGFEAPSPEPRTSPGSGRTPVGEDARLDCSRLEALLASMGGLPPATSLHEGLRICLSALEGHTMPLPPMAHSQLTEAREARIPRADAAIAMETDVMARGERTQEQHDPIASAHPDQHYKPLGAHNRQPLSTTAPPDKADRGDTRGSGGKEEVLRTAARAAALKNVFREELELAWRRYRDAACDGNPKEDLPSRASLAFLNEQDHRRGMIV